MTYNSDIFKKSLSYVRHDSDYGSRRRHWRNILGTRKSLRAKQTRRSTRRSRELLFVSQNVNHLKKDLSDLDLIIKNIETNTKAQSTTTFLSECALKANIQKEILGHEVFINGESSKTGGVGIILNKNSTSAWKQAGSKIPITIKGRIMGLHLEFGSNKQPIKIFAISVYLPCTRSKDYKEREQECCSLLNDLKELIQKECTRRFQLNSWNKRSL